MSTLVEYILFLVSGAAAITVNAHIPGAVSVELRPTRQVMSARAPWFLGQLSMVGDHAAVVSCADLPYWDGQTVYPCFPSTVTMDARQPVTVWPSESEPGSVVAVRVSIIGYPPRAFLPMVSR